MPIKFKKVDPNKKTSSMGETINKYGDAVYVNAKDKLESNGGKPSMQKTRKKGSTTTTINGKPVKGKF